MSQFFFIVYSITQNIQFVQCTVFLSFSPVYFVSVLFVAWKCTHENISYLTTLAFFSLSLSLNDYLLLSRFTNTIGWRKKNRKKNQQHRLNMQVRKVRAKTPIFTRHTATKRECNEQCKAQYTYNSQKGKKNHRAHRSIARITIYKYILCSAFNLIVAIAVVDVVVVVAVFVVIVIVDVLLKGFELSLPRCRLLSLILLLCTAHTFYFIIIVRLLTWFIRDASHMYIVVVVVKV